jgi:transglutaminase-like putative cysteine protease
VEIRVGYELIYDCPRPTPMILMLNIHNSRASDIIVPDHFATIPSIPLSAYLDAFGNRCTRLVAPSGQLRIASAALVKDSGEPDIVATSARQHSIQELPEEALVFLLGSRYCDTEKFSEVAWSLFGQTPSGWGRVQAICDFVHNHISFGYEHARATRTSWEAFNERRGVCRDYAHLAVALCRCMNIPARYCTGYLGDIGTLPPYGPMDFAAWFEAYLGGRWYTFDARNNVPRIGRVLMARGRDAIDVAIATTFGTNTLVSFKVWTDEVILPTSAPVSVRDRSHIEARRETYPMCNESPLPGRLGTPAGPICPVCFKPMKLSQITPVIFSYDMDDQVFACVECGTKLTRMAQRSPCRGHLYSAEELVTQAA